MENPNALSSKLEGVAGVEIPRLPADLPDPTTAQPGDFVWLNGQFYPYYQGFHLTPTNRELLLGTSAVIQNLTKQRLTKEQIAEGHTLYRALQGTLQSNPPMRKTRRGNTVFWDIHDVSFWYVPGRPSSTIPIASQDTYAKNQEVYPKAYCAEDIAQLFPALRKKPFAEIETELKQALALNTWFYGCVRKAFLLQKGTGRLWMEWWWTFLWQQLSPGLITDAAHIQISSYGLDVRIRGNPIASLENGEAVTPSLLHSPDVLAALRRA